MALRNAGWIARRLRCKRIPVGDEANSPSAPASASAEGVRASPGPARFDSAFWFTYWLAIVLCLTKLIVLGHPRSGAAAHWDFAKNFAAAVS